MNPLVLSLNNFAFEALGLLIGADSNAVFSPYSAFSCVSLVVSLFKNETRDEILRALKVGQLPNNEDFYAQLKSLSDQEVSEFVSIYNSLFVNQAITFSDGLFRHQESANANIRHTNFPQPACDEINGEVNKQTHGHITSIVSPDDVPSNTTFVLLNAIYFQSTWINRFNIDERISAHPFFRLLDGTMGNATVMTMKNVKIQYAENDNYQVISLPYEGNKYDMILILPRADGIDALKAINYETFTQLVGQMQETKVTVMMPKFQIESKHQLKEAFSQLGMKRAFDSNAQGADEKIQYYVDKIIQKAKIIVDENGTVATAATAVVAMFRCAPTQREIYFNANHPFLYVLKDSASGAFLFNGILVKP